MQKRYPFKFLDSYTREDSDIFFGREAEVAALYEMIFQTDLLLVQGPSGVGKTSLIKCGLSSKFESHDWLALDIRRGSNLNDALDEALLKAGGIDREAPENEDLDWLYEDLSEEAPTASEAPTTPLTRSLKAIYLKHFKPIYLIFDQFEELYTIGNKPEQDAFVERVQEILRVKLPVKIILSIREEYLGHLYDFERKVPELQRKKLRVEPMNQDKVKHVILSVGKLKNGNVHLKHGEEEAFATKIFEKIREDKKTLTIDLPYLQVLLDKLYLQAGGDEHRKAEVTLSEALLHNVTSMGDVLRDFLDEQVLTIASSLKETPETIWQILSPFATLDGTKEPLALSDLMQRRPDRDLEFLQQVVEELVSRRILRFDERAQRYEIAHDSLARRINDKRSEEEIAVLEVQRLVKNQVANKGEARAFFTEAQLGFIEPLRDKLALLPAEQEWIQESRREIEQRKIEAEAKAREELERERSLKEAAVHAQREAEKARTDAEAQKANAETNAQRAKRLTWIAGFVAAFALLAALFAYGQYDSARKNEKQATDAKIAADSSARVADAQKINAETALKQVKLEQAATELQRNKADSSARVAVQKTKEAEANLAAANKAEAETKAALAEAQKNFLLAGQKKAEAEKALASTQAALKDVVRLSLKEAEDLINRLEYEAAVGKIVSLIPLGVSQDSLGRALLEPVFWFTETGDFNKAWGLLDTAYQLYGRQLATSGQKDRTLLRASLRALDSDWYAFLEARYFPKMVPVEGGEFTRGYGEDSHKVIVSSFQMAETETTWWQYGLYVEANKGKVAMPEAPGWSIDGDNPVVNVSWYDVLEYANWVSDRKGVAKAYPETGENVRWTGSGRTGYRLPTEAEWEYAARGGKQQEYAGTDSEEMLEQYAWYYANSKSRTQPVRTKKPNAFGLYDMSGNIWEWCWDWYDNAYYTTCAAQGVVANPVGPEVGSNRVLRGGSWGSYAEDCRSTDRINYYPDSRNIIIGFRLVFVP